MTKYFQNDFWSRGALSSATLVGHRLTGCFLHTFHIPHATIIWKPTKTRNSLSQDRLCLWRSILLVFYYYMSSCHHFDSSDQAAWPLKTTFPRSDMNSPISMYFITPDIHLSTNFWTVYPHSTPSISTCNHLHCPSSTARPPQLNFHFHFPIGESPMATLPVSQDQVRARRTILRLSSLAELLTHVLLVV